MYVSPGNKNEYSGFEGEAVRAELQEQRVYAEAIQTHRYHMRFDVFPAILWRECI